MKSFFLQLFVAIQLFTFLACGASRADVFDDAKALGRGVNLGNALEANREGNWGLTLEDWHFEAIAEGGFDSVRVPIRWSAHAADDAPYAIDAAFFERIDWVVEQAESNGLNVVLDLHHYSELNADPAGHRDRFLGIWDQIATHYQDAPQSVYFELLNEPNYAGANLLNPAAWNALIVDALEVVRRTNPQRAVIVGPTPFNAVWNLGALKLPNDDHLITTFHFYRPFEFSHQGADFVDGAEEWVGRTWGSPEERAEVREAFDEVAKWAKDNNRPVFLGEFGVSLDASPEDRARWAGFLRGEAEARGFSWAYWEFAAAFGVYDKQLREWIEPIHSALVPQLAGDLNGDGAVDAADYTTWRDGLGIAYTPDDYEIWRAHFGDTTANARGETAPVAEPGAHSLLTAALLVGLLACVARRSHATAG